MKHLFSHSRLKLTLLLLLAILALPTASRAQAQETALIVAPGQHIAGSVSTVAQDIRVEGVVDGDVTSWSGSITVVGTVGGDVVSYGGSVVVAATGRVGGHVLAAGGKLRMDAGAVVAGQVISGDGRGELASLIDLFIPANEGDGLSPVGRALFAVVAGVLLLAFCLISLALWPRRTGIALATLQLLPGRAVMLGLLTTLAIGLASMPLAGLLVASVVGVPLLVILLVLALVPYVYGLAVLARMVGERLPGSAAPRLGADNPAFLIVIGLAAAIVTVGFAAPPWGLALFYLLGSPGLGAVILSRGGTMLPLAAQ